MSEFLTRLDVFIWEVRQLPRFKGQAQAVKALQRVYNLSVFRQRREAP